MSQQQAAQLLSKVLSNVAKYSVVAGVGITALQSSLYTGVDRAQLLHASWVPSKIGTPSHLTRSALLVLGHLLHVTTAEATALSIGRLDGCLGYFSLQVLLLGALTIARLQHDK